MYVQSLDSVTEIGWKHMLCHVLLVLNWYFLFKLILIIYKDLFGVGKGYLEK